MILNKFNFKKKFILKKKDFLNILYNKKKIIINSYFTKVYILKNTYLYPRIGIIIKKKYISLSVNRNKIKRIIKDLFRKNKEYITNIDIIFIINKNNKFNKFLIYIRIFILFNKIIKIN